MTRRVWRFEVLALFAVVVSAAAARSDAASRSDITSAQAAIAQLNAERAANGLPGDITENTDWSNACRLHNHYMALNNAYGHDENPLNPGYTKVGAWAGQNSVLAEGT